MKSRIFPVLMLLVAVTMFVRNNEAKRRVVDSVNYLLNGRVEEEHLEMRLLAAPSFASDETTEDEHDRYILKNHRGW